MSVLTPAAKLLLKMKRAKAEEADIKAILESSDKTVQYLAETFWKKIYRKLDYSSRLDCHMTTITFRPWMEMQKMMRKDKVYEAAIKSHNFPLDQISKVLVERAIADGFNARIYEKMHHPEGEGSPYPETFIQVSFPDHSETEEGSENWD